MEPVPAEFYPCLFEKAAEVAPLDQVEINSPAGTHIALFMQEGGNVAAYGRISSSQPTSLGGVKVNVPSKSWLVVDVDVVIIPSAAVILHILPQPASTSSQKTKAGAYTVGNKTLTMFCTFRKTYPLLMKEIS
jgi:hypothetical protein